MPFISSISARQSGLLFANAAKLTAPTFGSSTSTSSGFTFSISNYDSSATYSLSVSNPAPYAIGDTGPAGGKIFITPLTAVNFVGGYFEAAPSGSPDVVRKWASPGLTSTSVTGADGTLVGTGSQNTIDIVAQGNVAASSAAAYCADYGQGGASDWFLPSKDELGQMYVNKTAIGGFTAGAYWSSSENSNNSAHFQSFSSGSQITEFKSQFPGLSVRPARSFVPMATQSAGLVTVTGVSSSAISTVTVTVSKNGWLNNSSTKTGIALIPYLTEFTILGGGGSEAGGGGSMTSGSMRLFGGSSYTVTVGAGGTGNGKGNDSILGGFSGGGGGGRDNNDVGGSYSGGSIYTESMSEVQTDNTSGVIQTIRYKGGAYGSGADYNVGHNGIGGGGGAGGNGGNGSAEQGGNGGPGKADFLGTVRGGGGGGHSHLNGGGTSKPSGGSGGGGAGTNYNFGCDTSSAGSTNYGAGGGSNWGECGGSNAGGSGIVIIRYTGSTLASIGAGLVYSLSSSGSVRTYTFTGGTGTITF
jgi:hypothetical protein